jgi:septation ring formation regulator EzrA
MNVNDLADRLEQFYQGTHIDKAAETLRQQAQEIKNCKMDIYALKTFNNDLEQEIEALKQRLELAEWDENAWKKFKRDNYEVINLTPRSKE